MRNSYDHVRSVFIPWTEKSEISLSLSRYRLIHFALRYLRNKFNSFEYSRWAGGRKEKLMRVFIYAKFLVLFTKITEFQEKTKTTENLHISPLDFQSSLWLSTFIKYSTTFIFLFARSHIPFINDSIMEEKNCSHMANLF